MTDVEYEGSVNEGATLSITSSQATMIGEDFELAIGGQLVISNGECQNN